MIKGGLLQQITARDDYPQRTDMSDVPPARTHKHTLYGLQEGVSVEAVRFTSRFGI